MTKISIWDIVQFSSSLDVESNEISYGINDHLQNFVKDAVDVDYDGVGPCIFYSSLIGEFDFCVCSGNLGTD